MTCSRLLYLGFLIPQHWSRQHETVRESAACNGCPEPMFMAPNMNKATYLITFKVYHMQARTHQASMSAEISKFDCLSQALIEKYSCVMLLKTFWLF
jgi:hypothetical protein